MTRDDFGTERVSRILYEEELVFDGNTYSKEW